jgi:hypothetical protein
VNSTVLWCTTINNSSLGYSGHITVILHQSFITRVSDTSLYATSLFLIQFHNYNLHSAVLLEIILKFQHLNCIRIVQNNTPAIATVGFIVVIGYYLTTCFGPHGPSSGEYNILIRPRTSSENYRYHNGSAILSMSLPLRLGEDVSIVLT